jgi:hypothetical protein
MKNERIALLITEIIEFTEDFIGKNEASIKDSTELEKFNLVQVNKSLPLLKSLVILLNGLSTYRYHVIGIEIILRALLLDFIWLRYFVLDKLSDDQKESIVKGVFASHLGFVLKEMKTMKSNNFYNGKMINNQLELLYKNHKSYFEMEPNDSNISKCLKKYKYPCLPDVIKNVKEDKAIVLAYQNYMRYSKTEHTGALSFNIIQNYLDEDFYKKELDEFEVSIWCILDGTVRTLDTLFNLSEKDKNIIDIQLKKIVDFK